MSIALEMLPLDSNNLPLSLREFLKPLSLT